MYILLSFDILCFVAATTKAEVNGFVTSSFLLLFYFGFRFITAIYYSEPAKITEPISSVIIGEAPTFFSACKLS